MIRITVWDIEGGERSQVVAEVRSAQMTDSTLRDDEDQTLLYLNETTSMWVVFDDGTEWTDFTIEAISRGCGASFMGGATCILPQGHSSPHASGE